MESVVDSAAVAACVMPRFEDGSINLQELIRSLTEAVVNQIMDAEANQVCTEGSNSRNGYRERRLVTCVGTITMRIPKLRVGSFFPDDVVERYQRVDRALVAAVAEMYASGTSTRKVQRIAQTMGIDRLSKDQVSAICSELDAEVADLRDRELPNRAMPYLWLDATYVKCRREGHVASTAVVTAIGCDDEGWRHVLGFGVVDTESYGSWSGFLGEMRARGITGVQLVISDAHEGLRRAIEETFQGAAWQRCVVHLERDCCRQARNRVARTRVARIIAPVFRAKDQLVARVMYHKAIEMLEDVCPGAARVMAEAEPDALAYLDFPASHWKRLRTNNLQERTNRELKRRSRVVQVFPSIASLDRLAGAILAEQDEAWDESRYFSQAKIDELYAEATELVEPEEERLREIEEIAERALVASLSLADEMEAA